MSNKRFNNRNRDKKAPISLSINELDSIIEYLFTESKMIKRKQLKNLEQLFKIIDDRLYQTDEELAARFQFIQRVIDAKLRLGLIKYNLIITNSLNSMDREYRPIIKDFIFDILEGGNELSDKEIEFINKFVVDHLNYYFVYQSKDEIQSIMEDLELGDFEDLRGLVERMKTSFQHVLKNIRMADADEADNLPFSFLGSSFSENLDEVVTELKKPTRFLTTGIQGLNDFLGGGFESGRAYLWLGAPSSGKSILLLTLAYQIAKYNQDLPTIKDGKKKCVIYLTQENSKKETVERLWNIAVSNSNIRDFSNQEIENVFKQHLPFSDDSECDLVILYRKNKKISTDDLYTIIQELEDDGYEVIALVQDYAKRIKASYNTGDIRIDLGEVINDFTVLAKEKDIPVITASQINRAGVEIIENALKNNQEDIGKQLSGANIGESYLMIENADFVAINNREFKLSSTQWFTTLKQVKDRAGRGKVKYIAQPCDPEMDIRMLEDIDGEPLYRESVSELKAGEVNFDSIEDADDNRGRRGKKVAKKKVAKKETKVESIEDLDDLIE